LTSLGEPDGNVDACFGSLRSAVTPEDRSASGALERERRAMALQELATVRHRRELLEIEELSKVSRARAAGAKWVEIGTALRVSERAVSRKYGPLLRPRSLNGPAPCDCGEPAAF
jgi:hypothetical protein